VIKLPFCLVFDFCYWGTTWFQQGQTNLVPTKISLELIYYPCAMFVIIFMGRLISHDLCEAKLVGSPKVWCIYLFCRCYNKILCFFYVNGVGLHVSSWATNCGNHLYHCVERSPIPCFVSVGIYVKPIIGADGCISRIDACATFQQA